MAEDIFRTLQERLDKYSLGFPATESGIEIAILRELFSEEDAALFLSLTPEPEPAEAIAERIDPTRVRGRHPLDIVQYTWLKTMMECQILTWGGDRVYYGKERLHSLP